MPKTIARICVRLKSKKPIKFAFESAPTPIARRTITIHAATTAVISNPYFSAIFIFVPPYADKKEMVLKTVSELPDDCSIDEIADRIEFLAAVQKGARSARPRRRYSARGDQK